MCGILGVFSSDFSLNRLRELGLWQSHRGPDAWGEYRDGNLYLGHNRLSIIDPEYGSQPMKTADEHLVIVYNGEIYNHRALKKELISGEMAFQTDHSDTEVILQGYKKWGVNIVNKLRGMFAFAIYDKSKKKIFLARDAVGIKPLYYYKGDGDFIFSSEIKPIVSFKDQNSLNNRELGNYFLYRSVPGNATLFKDIKKVLPGHFLHIDMDDHTFSEHQYFELDFDINSRVEQKDIERTIRDSVTDHLVSDVPVGVFLSGGVDSSLVSAFASEERDIKAFNIGLNSKGDETPFAKRAADYLNIGLTTRYLDARDFVNYFDRWMYHNDDPVADPSALALMALSEFVHEENYKVMLAGEGADELFIGYNSYLKFVIMKKYLAYIPGIYSIVGSFFPRVKDYKGTDRFPGTAHVASKTELNNLFTDAFRYDQNEPSEADYHGGLVSKMKESDQRIRLPNDLLSRTDRATMAYSVEARVPFLINGVIEMANNLSLEQLINVWRLEGKKILKEVASNHLPKDIIYRKKMGFGLPLEEWLRGTFNNKIHHYLEEQKIDQLNYDYLKYKYGKLDNTAFIWAWLILEQWHRNWIDEDVLAPQIPDHLNLDSYTHA